MTQAVVQVRNIVARSGFANPLTLEVLVTDEDYLKVYADTTLLDNGPDYEITGIGDPNGVSIEIIGAEDVDEYVGVLTFTALYDPPLDQQSDLSAGGVLGRGYESGLDQQNRRLQAQGDRIDRALKVNVNIDGDIILDPVDGQMPIWNGDTQQFDFVESVPSAQAEASAAAAAASAAAAALSATDAETEADAAAASAVAAAASAAAAALAETAAELAETNAETAQAAAELAEAGAAAAAEAAANAALATKVSKSGDTMTGPLSFTHQASPANPGAGLLSLFAKNDDKFYSRTSAGVETEIGSGAATALRNHVKNGNFAFHRSADSQTSSGYGSDDDWNNLNAGSTKTHSLEAFTVGQTDVPGEPRRYSRTVVTSVAGASNYVMKGNRIGRAPDIAGQTVTLTLWGKAASGTPNIAAEIRCNYGTGGSPSATETFATQLIPLTTSWGKKTYALVIPSISGKTFGTNQDDFVELNIWYDAGSSFNSRTGSLGQQSGTFDVAQVSLLVGDLTAVAVPWRDFPRQGISSVGFGRQRPALANVYTTIDFYRNPGTALVTGVSAAAWAWPGTALTASTHSIPVGARMKLVQAIWWLIWNPNSAGAGTAVRLVTADAGPTNIVALKQLATVTGSTPRNDSNDITPEMRAYLLAPETGTSRKTLGQQVFGDGAAGPLIYASWIECLWDVSPD